MEHDSSYHLLFSDSRLVEDLLRHFVPESWVAQLDFSTIRHATVVYGVDISRAGTPAPVGPAAPGGGKFKRGEKHVSDAV